MVWKRNARVLKLRTVYLRKLLSFSFFVSFINYKTVEIFENSKHVENNKIDESSFVIKNKDIQNFLEINESY